MKRVSIIALASVVTMAAVAVLMAGSATAQVQGSVPSYIKLQATSPGTAQAGNANISGTIYANRMNLGNAPDTSYALDIKGSGGVVVDVSTGYGVFAVSHASFPSPVLTGIVGPDSNANNSGVWGQNQVTSAEGFLGYGGNGVYGWDGGKNTNLAGHFDGKVGIGKNLGVGLYDPNFPLTFGSTNGDKISLFGNGGAVYGLGIQANLIQIHTDSASSDIAFGYGTSAAMTEVMRIKGNGNVGIGTSNPAYRFSVSGDADVSGTLHVTNLDAGGGNLAKSGGVGVARASSAGSAGILSVSGFFGSLEGFMGPNSSNEMTVGTLNDAGTTFTGGVKKTGNSTTTVFATIKNFVEPNPEDLSKDIVYACIEGPEAAMYIRGTGHLVNGRAHIDIPQHFRALAEEGTLTVLLTPMSLETKGMGVARKSLNGVDVGEIAGGQGNFDFDWEIKAVRSRFKDYKVERPWTERLKAGVDVTKAWANRQASFKQDRPSPSSRP